MRIAREKSRNAQSTMARIPQLKVFKKCLLAIETSSRALALF